MSDPLITFNMVFGYSKSEMRYEREWSEVVCYSRRVDYDREGKVTGTTEWQLLSIATNVDDTELGLLRYWASR